MSSELLPKFHFRSPVLARFLSLILVVVFVATTVSSESEARRRRHRHRKRSRARRAAIINEPKLYERMGGSKAISEIVDEWMRLSFVDSRVSALYSETTAKPDRIAQLRKSWTDELCALAEGPCPAKPPDPKKAPPGMAAPEAQFLALSENFLKAMQKRGISEREKNELLGRMGDYRSEVEPDEGESP